MISKDFLSARLKIAIQAATLGGQILEHYWGNLTEVREKDYAGDLVTEADQFSEKAIIDHLRMHFADDQILAEESGLSQTSSNFAWVIDPLDGTVNYAHQYPHFAVSIGLVYQSRPILGVIYNPITKELFQAAQGCGAQRNGSSIHVSQVSLLHHSLLATGFAYDRRENPDNNYKEFFHLTQLTQGVRRAGAAALDLAYVACGRIDGYWERGIKPWDIAAGMLIVEESGGKISDYHSNLLDIHSDKILASNNLLHAALVKELCHVNDCKMS